MRHLFITQDFGPDLGGMARHQVELCRRFPPGSLVVATVAHPGAAAFDPGEPYPIERQDFPFARAGRFANQLRWARWLRRRVGRGAGGVDLVHCGNVRPTGYGVWWTSRRAGTPYLLYVYGGDLLRERQKAARSAIKKASARAIFGRAAGVVAISDWSTRLVRDVMAEVGVRRAPPVANIPLGTDPAQYSPANADPSLRAAHGIGDAPVLLTVARLVPHKGQDVVIRALAALSPEFPGLRYVLIGEGHDEARLRALATELGVADRVIFAGAPRDDATVARWYATATLYVGLSRVDREINAEGFGIAFLEAAASGTPCVAGDSGGVRSAVRDGETGFVVPPTGLDDAVRAMRLLLADDGRRAAMAAAGRRAVEAYFNWDRVARETLDFAAECARRARAGDRPAGDRSAGVWERGQWATAWPR